MPREGTQLADVFVNLQPTWDPGKEATNAIGQDVPDAAVEVRSGARYIKGFFADIGAEDVDWTRKSPLAQKFQQCNYQAVDFLAGGASGNPDANRFARFPVSHNIRKDRCFQDLEHFGWAEAAGAEAALAHRRC